MTGLRRAVVMVAVGAVASGCFLLRSETPQIAPRSDFPPPLDAAVDGPLIWAEAHPSWGSAPLAVYFDVEPLEHATFEVWAWDFGDGTPIARRRQPQHTYRRAGIYEVHVWARDRQGRISMDTVKVRVEPSGD